MPANGTSGQTAGQSHNGLTQADAQQLAARIRRELHGCDVAIARDGDQYDETWVVLVRCISAAVQAEPDGDQP